MKKIFKIILTFLSAAIMFVSMKQDVYAAGSASGPATVTQGQSFDVTVYVNFNGVTSGSITVNVDSNLQIVSGKWKLSGTSLASFDGVNGAFAFASAKNISGAYFTVTLKGKNVASSAKVTFSGSLKNGGENVGSVSASKTVKIICANHSFSSWTTVEPTCTKNGSKSRTCSVCGTVDTQIIPAKGHTVAQFNTIKEPTCTESGTASGVCSVCKQNVEKVVPAKGHYFSEWSPIVEATCTEAGKENRTCKDCGFVEERTTQLAPHTMGEKYEVLVEPTISQYGEIEGACTVCGTVFKQVQNCTYVHEESGAVFSCAEGTFAADTVINVMDIDVTSLENPNLFDQVKAISGKYKLVDIGAVLNERPMKPNGTVDVQFPLPEGFSNNTAFIKINEDGSTRILSSMVNGENNTLSSVLDSFGTYAFVDLSEMNESTANLLEETNKSLNTYKYVSYGEAAAIVALAGVLVLKSIKKKKAQIPNVSK